ncbi:hypothetical protein N9S60_00245 [bacterium]|nr:hypothetical protein [bacterium]
MEYKKIYRKTQKQRYKKTRKQTRKKKYRKMRRKKYRKKTQKKKYRKKHNKTRKKKGGIKWKSGIMSALALGGPAAATNYGSPQMGTVGTQFGSTIDRLSNRGISSIDDDYRNIGALSENNNSGIEYTSGALDNYTHSGEVGVYDYTPNIVDAYQLANFTEPRNVLYNTNYVQPYQDLDLNDTSYINSGNSTNASYTPTTYMGNIAPSMSVDEGKILTHGAQANITLYKNHVLKTFKNTEQGTNDAKENFEKEVKAHEIINEIAKKNPTFSKPIKLLKIYPELNTIKYERHGGDVTGDTIVIYADGTRRSFEDGDVQKSIQSLDPDKFSKTQIDNLQNDLNILHSEGVVHGDIHAGNIAKTNKNGKTDLVLVDFGELLVDPAKERSHVLEKPGVFMKDVWNAGTLVEFKEKKAGFGKGKQYRALKALGIKNPKETLDNVEKILKKKETFLDRMKYDLSQMKLLTSLIQ